MGHKIVEICGKGLKAMWSDIQTFLPKKPFLLAVDSDGSVFDTMGIKHRKSFIPAMLKIWNLYAVQEECTRIEEEINLYSKTRGINRFPGLALTLDALKKATGHSNIPDTAALHGFCQSGASMSNAALMAYNKDNNEFLNQVLEWSKLCDELFTEHAKHVEPFEGVHKAFSLAAQSCDIIIVSAASGKGLLEDFSRCSLPPFLSAIAGQEYGSKQKQLSMLAEKYKPNHVLMVGDALGDLEAARNNNASFYPILPGHEAESWEEFANKALERFLTCAYEETAYEQKLLNILGK